MNLIGILGEKISGKKTVATIWQLLEYYYNSVDSKNENNDILWVLKKILGVDNNYIPISKWELSTWKQKTFDFKIKQICSIITGLDVSQWQNPEIFNRKFKGFLFYDNSNRIELSFSQLLRVVEQDLFASSLGHNIWTDALFIDYIKSDLCENGLKRIVPEYPKWIITDVKTESQLESILEKDGILIEVLRYNFEVESIINSVNIKPKYSIKNNSNLEHLISQVKDIMIKECIIIP